MKTFYQARLHRHLTQMAKYFRYVFNDHFVLVSFILFGGAAYYYAQAVKTLSSADWWGPFLVFGLMFLALFAGKLVTLAEAADEIFLLPKEGEMRSYFSRAYLYSMAFPLILLALVMGAVMPLLVACGAARFQDFFWFVLMLWGLKSAEMAIQVKELDLNVRCIGRRISLNRTLWLIFALVIIWIGFKIAPLAGALFGVAAGVAFTRTTFANAKFRLDWEKMVAAEAQRQQRIFHFIALFTDVPGIQGRVRRRRYLDPLLRKVPQRHENTYFYLMVHTFSRTTSYSGLYLRFLIFGTFFLFFVNQLYLSLFIAFLFLYLLGFQLLPLAQEYRSMILTQLYPLPKEASEAAVKKLLWILLSIVGIFYSVAVLSRTGVPGILFTGAAAAFVVLFNLFYVPYRLKRADS